MATASVTYTFTNTTTADATQVNQDFTDLTTFVNGQCIQKDGSLAMTQPLVLSGLPTLSTHAASKSYVDGGYVNASGGTAQLFSSGVYKTLIFSAENQDSLSEYTLATGVFTASRTGVYLVSFNGAYIANSANEHGMRINVNNGTTLYEANVFVPQKVNTVDGPKPTLSAAVFVASGGTIEPQVKVNASFSFILGEWLTIAWLHD